MSSIVLPTLSNRERQSWCILLAITLLMLFGQRVIAQGIVGQTYCAPSGTFYAPMEGTDVNQSLFNSGVPPTTTIVGTNLSYSTTAKVGARSADFNGTSNFIRYDNATFLRTGLGGSAGASLSIMFWVQADRTTGIQTLFEEGNTTNGVGIRLNGTTLQARAMSSGTSFDVSTAFPTDGAWHLVAFTLSPALDGSIKLYLDGALVGTNATLGSSAIQSHADGGGVGATVGSDVWGAGAGASNFFDGRIDDFYYSYGGNGGSSIILTPTLIQSYMNCVSNQDPANPSATGRFTCDGTPYISQSTGVLPTDLKKYDYASNAFTTLDSDNEVGYNAVGYNKVDNFLYGNANANGLNVLIRIGKDGTITNLGATIGGYNAGTITDAGIMYLSTSNSNDNTLARIDLNSVPYTTTIITLSQPIFSSDIAWNPKDGFIYALRNNNSNIMKTNPATGAVTIIPIVPAINSISGYGATWFDQFGNLYAYDNGGRLLRVDVTTGARFIIKSNAPVVVNNDGAACTTVLVDPQITKTVVSQSGDQVTFDLLLQNNGSGIAVDVMLRDILPAQLLFQSAQVFNETGGVLTATGNYSLTTPTIGTNGTVQLQLFNLNVGPTNQRTLRIVAQSLSCSSTITNCAEIFSTFGLAATNGTLGNTGDNTTLIPGDVATNNESCASVTFVGPTPPAVSASSLTLCSNDPVNITYTTTPAGQQVAWQRLPDGLTGTGNVTNFISNTTSSPQSYTYVAWTVGAAGCNSVSAVTTVTVNPRPEPIPTACSQTICSGQTGVIGFSSQDPNAIYHWTRTPTTPGPSSGTGDVSQTLINTGPTSITYTYQIWAESQPPASCPSSTTITCIIVVTPGLTVTAFANSATVCTGSPLSLSAAVVPAAGNYTYSWRGPNGYTGSGATPTVSAAATVSQSGTYTVVVTDAGGCSGTATVAVTVTACCPTPINRATLALCNNATLDLQPYVPAGGSFTLLTGATGSLSGSIFNGIVSGAGLFKVGYRASGVPASCAPDTITVIVRDCTPPPCNFPISAAVVDATCGNADGTAMVSIGGLPAGATAGFAWSNNGTGPSISGLQAGVYSVTATVSTSTGFCTVVDSVQVNDIGGPVAEINLISSADCQGATGAASINITTGTGPFLISWSGAASGSLPSATLGINTISNLAAGSYVFKVTGVGANSACASYLAITVPRNDSDQISVTAVPTNATACGSATGSMVITAVPAPGITGPFSFSLNGLFVGTSISPTISLSGLAAGVYTVSVSSAGGCTAANVPVTILDAGAPTIAGWSVVNPNCPSDRAQLLFAGGQPTATFLIREVTTGAIVGPIAGINGASPVSLTLPAGTYSIQQTLAGSSCSSLTTVTITVPEGLKFNVQYTKVTCAPGGVANNDGTISIIQITGGTPPYSTTILNAQNQLIAASSPDIYTNLKAGVYSIRVLDSKGCSGLENVFITVPDCNLQCPVIPLSTYVVDANCTANDGRAVAQLGNFADSDVDYLWSNNFSGPTTNGLAAGVYSVTATVLTGTFTGCPYIETVNVNQIGGPIVSQGTVNPSSCAANTGTVSFSISSGTGPFSVSWTGPVSSTRSVNGTVPFQFTQTGLAPGVYSFTFTASGSTCKTILDVTIPVSSSGSITLAATPTPASSCGAQNGSISLVASGSGPIYTYTVNGASYTTVSANTLLIPNLPGGVYTLGVISGTNGCSATTTAIIQELGAPPVTGWTSQDAICPNGTGSLTYAGGTGTGTYYISLGGTQLATIAANATGPVVTNLPQGIYTVELIDGACSSFQNFTITGPVGIDFNVQYIAETCGPGGVGNGDGILNVIQINGGTAPYTVSIIDNQGQTLPGASHTNLPAGNYYVSVVDANGCPGNQNALVTVPPCQLKCPPLAMNTSVLDNPCGQTKGEATAQLLNVPAGATATYLWSDGQNGPIASGLAANVYSVTATLFANNTIYAGCTYVDTVTVNDIGGPIATIQSTNAASCTAANGAVALNIQGGTSPYTVTWTDSMTTTGSQTVTNPGLVNITGLKAGAYVFTVTGANSACKSVINVVIPNRTPNGFTLTVTPTNVSSCGASDGKLTIVVSGGTGPFIYSVNGYVKGVSSSRTFTVQGLPAGVNTVTVMDANGCDVTTGNVLINPSGPSPIAGWTKTDALCPQTNGIIQFNGSGNAGDEYVVTISGTATEIGRTQGNASASFSVPGGTYLITQTSSTSCLSVTTIVVNQPQGLDFNIQYANPNCLSPASGSLTVVQQAGGTPPYSYTIVGPTGVVSSSSSPSVSSLLAGSYTVTLGDSRGCTFSDVVTLTTGSNLSVTASVTPAVVCIGSIINLSASAIGGTAPLTYAWSGPGGALGNGQSLTAIATVNTTFTVVVTDNTSCSASAVTAPVAVTLCPPLCVSPSLVLDGPVCDPVTGVSSLSYSVSLGATVSTNVGILNTLLQTITNIPANSVVVVTATVSGGCSSSATAITPATCQTCTTPLALQTSVGTCNPNGTNTYVASVTVTAGATLNVFGQGALLNGSTVTAPIGTNVTVVASIAGCASQTQVIGSPASCTGSCPTNPLISPVVVCDGNGSTYSIAFNVAPGVTVTASSGTIANGVVSGISLGTSVTLTAISSGCSQTQVIGLSAPSCPPLCQSPVLTVSGPVCDPVTGLSSLSYVVSAGASVTANVGVVNTLLNTITNIPANSQVVVTASVAGGCVTTRTVVTGTICTTCTTPIALQTGNAICNGTTYVASVTASSGATLTVFPASASLNGSTITAPIGTNVTVVASIAGCASQTQVIGSPASCTNVNPCQVVNPLVSAVTACDNNGSTYSVVFTAPAGVTVTASAGVISGNTITGITLGSSVTLTAVNSCSISQVVVLGSPVCPPLCQSPVLTVSGPVCDPVTGLSSLSYVVSAGASVTANVGLLNAALNIITNIPANSVVVVTASVAGGCVTTRTVVTGTICTTCTTPIALQTGNAICNGTTYVASVTASSGATLTVFPASASLNGSTITAPIGTNVTVVASIAGCASQTQVIGSPASCTNVNPCQVVNPLISGVTACDNNGSTYSVLLSIPAGVTVTASSGTLIGNVLSGLTLGSSVTLTAVNSCSISQVVVLGSPVCPPLCQSPVLTVSGPVCDPVTGLSSLSYVVSAGASVTANVGLLNAALNIITNIPANSVVVVTASVAGGCVTTRTVVTGTICTTCTTPIALQTGNAICNGTTYVASVTASSGATLTVFPATASLNGSTITAPIGTNVTVVASIAGCASQTQVIGSPASCTNVNPCQVVNPLVSAVTACDNNGSTYSVVFTAPAGVTVAASAGVISGNTITGITLGSSVTLTAVNSCSISQVVVLGSPVCPPLCQSPVLTVTGPVCDPVTGLSSLSYVVSAGASVTANVGVVNTLLNTITNIPANSQVVVTASVAGGCVTTRTVVTGTICTTCTTPIALQTGNAICNGTTYVASVTASSGATLTVFPASASLNGSTITAPIGTNVTVVASIAGCASQTQVIGSPASCTQSCPTSPLISISGPFCDGNGSTYSIHFAAPGGVTVTASSGTINNGVVSGISLGTSVTLTAISSGCSQTQVIGLTAPNCPPACVSPSLVLDGPVCDPVTGVSSLSYSVSLGATVSTNVGILNTVNQTITNIPANSVVVVTATVSGGCSSSATAITPATCTSCTTPLALQTSVGTCNPNGTNTYVASVTVTAGATLTVFPASASLNGSTVTAPIGTNVTVVASIAGCASQTQVIGSPASCTGSCPTNPLISPVVVCDGNGSTYSIAFNVAPGVTVTASSGLVVGNQVIGISLGTSVTLTAISSGCSQTQVIGLTAPSCPVPPCATPIGLNLVVTAAQCGSATGSITATPTGGVAPFSYQWSNGNGQASGVNSITGLSAGVYSVTITDANGCTGVSGSINLPGSQAPQVSLASVSAAACGQSTGAILVNVSGGTTPYTYQWSPNVGSTSAVSGLSAGTYTVTVSDGSGCGSTLTVVVPGSSNLSLVTSSSPAACGQTNGTATVIVSGGTTPYLYKWITGGSTASISGLSSGAYSVTVSDAGGCSSTAVVNVNSVSGPILTLSHVDAGCNATASGSASVSVTGGPAPYRYFWSNGGLTSSITNLGAGTYTVTVVDANGCQASGQVTIGQPAPIIATYNPTRIVCPSTVGSVMQVSISGGTAPFTYAWSNGGTTASLIGVPPGSYTVTITDAHGCVATGMADILPVSCASCLQAFVYLQGALVDADGVWPANPQTGTNGEPLMRDELRALNLIPLADPYRTAPYLASFYPGGAASIAALDPFPETIVNPGVALAARGDSSVVDWVLVEFRDPATPSVVKYTRSGLVLRNGAIVDVDGRSCLDISHVAGGNYSVAVRHRNHLGAMTQSTVSLNTGATQVTVDFRKLTPPQIWHNTSDPVMTNLYGDKERRDISWAAGYYALWGGNANRDDKTIYQGQQNDPQEVFNQITTALGNTLNTPSYILNGYYSGDVNMDGKTIFQGQQNDTHIIYNIMIQHPSNGLNNPSFIINQQLP